MQPINQVHTLALNAYWFGVSFMWNAIHPILLPALLLSFSDQAKNTLYGLLTFLGLVVAMIVQPLSGALSDRTRHPWGRRRPWILAGVLSCLIWLLGMVSATRYWQVGLCYVLLQFSSNVAHGPAQGLIPDLVPSAQHGAAAGQKSLFEMLGIILAALIISRLMETTLPRPLLAAILIAALLLVTGSVTFFAARKPTAYSELRPEGEAGSRWLGDLLDVKLRRYPRYAQLLRARFSLFLGSYSVQAFAYYFLMDVVGHPKPSMMMGRLMSVIGISVLVIAYPAGLLSERWGRKGVSLAACGISGIGMALLTLFPHSGMILALGALIGIGVGAFTSVNWAWATDLVPTQEAGKYLGLSNIATAGAAACSRLLGPAIDVLNNVRPNAGYSALFLMATLAAFVSLVLIAAIPGAKQQTQIRP